MYLTGGIDKIEIAEIEGVTTLILKGALVGTVPVAQLHLTLDHLLSDGRKKLALDTRGLSRIDTVGMAEIFGSVRRAKKAVADLSLITNAFVDGRVTMRIFRLDVHIESFDTEEKGIVACSKRRRA